MGNVYNSRARSPVNVSKKKHTDFQVTEPARVSWLRMGEKFPLSNRILGEHTQWWFQPKHGAWWWAIRDTDQLLPLDGRLFLRDPGPGRAGLLVYPGRALRWIEAGMSSMTWLSVRALSITVIPIIDPEQTSPSTLQVLQPSRNGTWSHFEWSLGSQGLVPLSSYAPWWGIRVEIRAEKHPERKPIQ